MLVAAVSAAAEALLRTDGGRDCRSVPTATSDGDGGGAVDVFGVCFCDCADVCCEAVVAGTLAGVALTVDFLGTMDGLNRAPPFSIRDDMVKRA